MKTTLTLLGTGTPGCYPNAYQTAVALTVGEIPFVIDCGGGTIQRLSSACDAGQPILAFKNLKTVILTHLHPDHSAGLADFIISTWIMGRQDPLMIYGPAGTQKMVDHLIQAYELGIAEHWETKSPTSWPLKYAVVEYTDGELIATPDVTVTAFRVSHGGMETYGLKFVTAEKSILFSGDTRPDPAIIKYGKGSDVVVHEVYSEMGIQNAPPRMPLNYFRRMHTSTVELAEIANQIKPKKLILNHQMHLGPVSDDELLKEITDRYAGEVIFGRDLDVFEL
ncbi:MAG: MBL fold metallo-hydrolase [Chloroflexota bacterium]